MHVPSPPLSCLLSSFSFPFPILHSKPQELTANIPCPSPLTVGISEIPYSAARQLPNATEWIPGSDNQYLVELDVFHQLHCLNSIRKTFFPERYPDFFKDYWLDDGSLPGRAGRNYTSIDAKHYGEFSFFPHSPSLSLTNLFPPSPLRTNSPLSLPRNRPLHRRPATIRHVSRRHRNRVLALAPSPQHPPTPTRGHPHLPRLRSDPRLGQKAPGRWG